MDLIDGWTLWVTRLNQRGGLIVNGLRYPVNLTLLHMGLGNSPVDVTNVILVAKQLVAGAFGRFHAAFSPLSAAWTIAMLDITEPSGLLVVSGGASADNTYRCSLPPSGVTPDCVGRAVGSRRFQSAFATSPLSSILWDSTMELLAFTGVQTVALISMDDPGSWQSGQAAAATAVSLRMSVVANIVAPASQANQTMMDQWVHALMTISSAGVDALLLSTIDIPTCNYLINSLKRYNWMPRVLGLTYCPVSTLFQANVEDPLDQRYILSPLIWDARTPATVDPVLYPNELWTSTYSNASSQDHLLPNAGQEFVRDFVSLFQHDPSYYASTAAISAVLLQNAYQLIPVHLNASSAMVEAIAAMSRVYEQTFFAWLQVNPLGVVPIETLPVSQSQARDTVGTFEIVSPISSATAAFVYPMPTWDERIYAPIYAATTIERVVLVIAGLGLLYLLVLLAIVVIYRNTPIWKAASPLFLVLMLIGALAMLSSVFFWTLYETDTSCSLHVWLFSLGYTTLFAALFAKTWRVFQIFNSNTLHTQGLTDSYLLTHIVVPALVAETVFVGIWQAVTPFRAVLNVPDPIRISNNYNACGYNTSSQTFFWTSVGCKIGVLLLGCNLAVLARKVRSEFNETKWITLSIYNIVVTMAILVPITTTNALDRVTCFTIRSFGLVGATLLTISILFLPKLYRVYVRGVLASDSAVKENASIGRGAGGGSKASQPVSYTKKLQSLARNHHRTASQRMSPPVSILNNTVGTAAADTIIATVTNSRKPSIASLEMSNTQLIDLLASHNIAIPEEYRLHSNVQATTVAISPIALPATPIQRRPVVVHFDQT